MQKSPMRILKAKYPELTADMPPDVAYEIHHCPVGDPSFPEGGYRLVWLTDQVPEPTEQELLEWETANGPAISAMLAEAVSPLADVAFDQLAQVVTGDENIGPMKLQKWRQQQDLAERWDEAGRPAIVATGKYKRIYDEATIKQIAPADLALEWLTKGRAWTSMVDGYGLFVAVKKKEIAALSPDEAEAAVNDLAANGASRLAEFLGI